MSIDSVDHGTDCLMLQICRRMPKHVHTSLITCDLTAMLLSMQMLSHELRWLVSPEQSQLQGDLTETDDANVVENELRLCGDQLKTVCAHTFGNLFDAAAKVAAK